MGTLILWFTWLFFNAGSSLSVIGNQSKTAGLCMLNTILCPSSCGITTYLIKNRINKPEFSVRSDYLGITSGISAGLVAITAGCNCV